MKYSRIALFLISCGLLSSCSIWSRAPLPQRSPTFKQLSQWELKGGEVLGSIEVEAPLGQVVLKANNAIVAPYDGRVEYDPKNGWYYYSTGYSPGYTIVLMPIGGEGWKPETGDDGWIRKGDTIIPAGKRFGFTLARVDPSGQLVFVQASKALIESLSS